MEVWNSVPLNKDIVMAVDWPASLALILVLRSNTEHDVCGKIFDEVRPLDKQTLKKCILFFSFWFI